MDRLTPPPARFTLPLKTTCDCNLLAGEVCDCAAQAADVERLMQAPLILRVRRDPNLPPPHTSGKDAR